MIAALLEAGWRIVSPYDSGTVQLMGSLHTEAALTNFPDQCFQRRSPTQERD